MTRYEFEEIYEKALTGTKEDRLRLLDWFDLYGEMYWNGEYYALDNGKRLFPITKYGEDFSGLYEVIDAEII